MDINAFHRSPAGKLIRSQIGNYWTFVPHPLPPALTWSLELVNSLSAAERALGKLDVLSTSVPNPHLLMVPFVRREAVVSSGIEGTVSTLSDLYVFETEQARLFDLPADVREVHNYIDALEYSLQRLETLPVSLRLIREIHAHLLAGVRGEDQTPGEFRRSQNWIGAPNSRLDDAVYVPPTVSEMVTALQALEGFIHSESTLRPLIRLGLIHYQFEAIHPFLDGNGRVGRLLLILLLCSWGLLSRPLLYPSAYFAEHRRTYYDLLLAVSRDGAWEAWLCFFLDGIASQADDAVARAQRLQDLREQYHFQLSQRRIPARVLQAVDVLFARPILRVEQLATALDVSIPTAQSYIDYLATELILQEITGQARNRIYRADAVLDAIETPLPATG